MHPRVAVDAEAKSLVGDFVEDSLAELHDVLLFGFLACGVVQNLAYNAGIAGAENVMFGYANEVSGSKAGHKAIV
jgi:hypothetical protein